MTTESECFESLVNSALPRINKNRKPRQSPVTAKPMARVFGVWQTIDPFAIGDKVRNTAGGPVYTVTACVYDEHYNAWDVTAINADGAVIGEFGHNLELVTE